MTDNSLSSNSTNNFNILRLLAASLVVYSHSYGLSIGSYELEPLKLLTGYFTFGHLAVAIFFVISGYLITISWNRKPIFLIFCWKRFLRIYPGMMAAILFSVFIIGPIATSLNLNDYLASIPYLQIIKGMVVLGQSNLPGVFINNTYPNAVNASLWTLFWEAKMYFITAILGLTGILKMRWPIVYITLFAIVITYFKLTLPIIDFFVIDYSVYYLMGTLFAIYNNSIMYRSTLLAPFFLIWILSFKTPFFTLLTTVFLPYSIMYLALEAKVVLQKLLEMGDFSYGVYIYAFPIQQLIVHLFQNEISPIKLFSISFPITIICSYFSWNFIEKKALDIKNIDINKIRMKIWSV